MLDASNTDEIEEYDAVEELSLEGLSATGGDDELGHSLTMLKSANPKARQTSLEKLATRSSSLRSTIWHDVQRVQRTIRDR